MHLELTDKKILITGATGSLGKQLIYGLTQRSIKPIAQVRQLSDTRYIDKCKLEKRVADLRNVDEVARLVEGIDMIIHTAAWVNFRQDQLAVFQDINTKASVTLYNAAREAGVQRFVHVSTVAAVAGILRDTTARRRKHDPGPLANEETIFNLSHLQIPYIQTKRAAEVELEKAAAEGGPDLITVNPSIIVAPSRTGDDRGKATKAFSKWFVPDIPIWANLVDIRDVADGVIAALKRGRPGERYILGGDNITVHELVLAVSARLGKVPHLVRLPRAFYRTLARTAVALSHLTGRRKISFYPDLIKMLDFNWVYSSAKARRELNYRNRSLFVTLDDLLNNKFTGTYIKDDCPNGETGNHR